MNHKAKLSKFFIYPALFLAILFLGAKTAFAMCPVCTIAVGAGIGFSRWLGIDDVITGLWIGAFTVSLAMWTINFLEGRKIKFKFRKLLVTLGYFLLVVAPLFFMGIIGHPLNKIIGIDKILFGVILGSILYYITAYIYLWMKKKNGGHPYFPMQKVAMLIVVYAIASGIFYLILS